MERDEVLRLIKVALFKHVNLYLTDECKAVRDEVPSLRVEINGFNTIGDAICWMSQWHFSVRGAIAFAFEAIIEGEVRHDEFVAIPFLRFWGALQPTLTRRKKVNRDEALTRIKAALSKYADDLVRYGIKEDPDHMVFLRAEIDGIQTIGQAFRVMRREGFHVPGAVKLVVEVLVEDTTEDEFRAVEVHGWST